MAKKREKQAARKGAKKKQPQQPPQQQLFPFQLVVFRLLASTIAMRPRSETKIVANNCDLDLYCTWHGNDKTFRVWFDATAILYAVHDIFPDEFASISATYRVSYNVLRPEAFPKDHDMGNKMAMMLAVPVAWPFWRQYFHETLAKMGYPPFMLPVMRLPTGMTFQALPPTDSVPPPTGLEPRPEK
jgi:hypothetical protein